MAFTKIVSPGIDTTGSYTVQELNTVGVVTAGTVQVGSATTIHTTGIDLGSGNITSHNINSTGIISATSFVGPVTGNITGDINATSGTFSGNVSIGGTLTYEDVTNIDSVGVVTARSGINVTGGSVGINTTVPAEKLDVWGTIRASQGPSEYIHLYPVAGAGYFEVSNSTTYPAIVFRQKGSSGTQERLRITSDGKVRVPDNGKFTAGAGDDLQIWSDNTDQYIRGEQNQLLIRSNNLKLQSYLGENYIHAANNNAVSLYYDNSKKLETTTTGATITSDLILDHASGDKAIRWATGGTNKWSIYHNNGAGALVAYDNANNAERLRITSAGRVGIDQSSPQSKVQIDLGDSVNFDNGDCLTLSSGNGSSANLVNKLNFGVSSTNGYAWIKSTKPGTGPLNLVLQPDGGNIGINSTNPAYELSINGTGAVRNEIVCTDNNGAGAGVYFRTMNGGSMVSNSTIRTDNAGNLQFFIGTSSDAERLRITSGGHIISGNLSINGSVNTDNTTVSGYTQIQSDNHANTFFGQNLKLGANSGNGDHTLRIINQHGSIGGAGMLIGGNGSGRENTINFYAESANQVPTTEVQANSRMRISSTAATFTSSCQPRNQYANAQTYLRTFGFTFNLQDGETETIFYNPDGYRRIYYEMWIQSGHGSNGYGYLRFNSSRYGTTFHEANWYVAYTTYAHSGTVNGNVNHNGIKFTRSGAGGTYTQVTYYCIVKAYSPAGGNPFSTSGLTDASYRYYSHGF